MMFLVILGVIGLAGIGACLYAVTTDGYGSIRTRDSARFRDDFDHAEFHARAV